LPGYDPDDTLYADKTAPGGNYGTHVHYNENYREGSRYSYALGGGKRKRYDDPDYPEGYVVQDPRYTRANYPSEMHLDEVDYLDGVQASTLAEEISHGQRAMEGGLFAQGAEFEGTGLTNYIATLSEETRAKTDAFFDVAREEGWDVALAQFPNIATTWLSYVKSDQLIAPTESHFVRSSRSFVGTPWISDIESTELLDNFERFKDKPAYDPASVRVSSSPRFQNNTFIENASYALFGQNNRYNKYYDSGDIRSTEDRFGLITNKDLKGTDEYIDADRRYDVLKNIFMADFENYEHGVPESSKNMHFIRDEFKYDSSLSIKEFFPTREEFRRYVEEFEENDINLYSITRSPDVEYGDDTWLMAEKIQQLDSYMTQHIAKTHNVQEAGPLQTIQNYLLRTSTPSYQSYTDVVDRYDHDYEYNPGEGGPIKSQIYRSGNKILDNLRKLKFWDKEGE